MSLEERAINPKVQKEPLFYKVEVAEQKTIDQCT